MRIAAIDRQTAETLWTYNYGIIVHHPVGWLRSIVHCHPACHCRMERDWTMPDSICRYPHRHLVVAWINKIILEIPVVD